MATIAALQALSIELKAISEMPRLDVELLLCHATGRERIYLMTWPERELTPDQEAEFRALFQRRLKGEPIAHLIGMREFWSLPLNVSPATLIPRPDTELLVETALNHIPTENARVLDLGTGTGAIALALASEKPGWSITAVDVQPGAVALAQENARQLQLTQVAVFQSDWFSAVKGEFDLIVSNPPYIDENDVHLSRGDVRFEPASALVADNNGLADIEKIVAEAHGFLAGNGWLMVEHGAGQGCSVRRIFTAMGYQKIQTLQDLGANERVTIGRYPEQNGWLVSDE